MRKGNACLQLGQYQPAAGRRFCETPNSGIFTFGFFFD